MRLLFKLVALCALIVSLSACNRHWDSYSRPAYKNHSRKVPNANGKGSKRKPASRTRSYKGGGHKTKGIINFHDSYGRSSKPKKQKRWHDSYSTKQKNKGNGRYRDTYRNKQKQGRRFNRRKLKRPQKGVFQ